MYYMINLSLIYMKLNLIITQLNTYNQIYTLINYNIKFYQKIKITNNFIYNNSK